jgi:hypothetical protein
VKSAYEVAVTWLRMALYTYPFLYLARLIHDRVGQEVGHIAQPWISWDLAPTPSWLA